MLKSTPVTPGLYRCKAFETKWSQPPVSVNDWYSSLLPPDRYCRNFTRTVSEAGPLAQKSARTTSALWVVRPFGESVTSNEPVKVIENSPVWAWLVVTAGVLVAFHPLVLPDSNVPLVTKPLAIAVLTAW